VGENSLARWVKLNLVKMLALLEEKKKKTLPISFLPIIFFDDLLVNQCDLANKQISILLSFEANPTHA
jgi:hypothetical protein